MEDLVRQAGEGAGIHERHFPHRWRHTCATSLLRRGVDIYKAKRLLEPSKLVTRTTTSPTRSERHSPSCRSSPQT
ncbi:MAG: tyrosine-type recombinase/integrase [Acidimicrobiales bacterium]